MKKGLLFVLCIFLTSIVIAACGGDNKSNQGNDAVNNNGENEQEQVTLRMSLLTSYQDLIAEDFTEKLEEEFYPEHPHINIEFVYIPFNEYDNQVMVAHQGQDHYDLLLVNHSSVRLFAQAGILEPLDAFVENSSTVDLANYHQEYLTASYSNDTLYGLPFNMGFRVFAYNKDILEEAGVDPPQTMEEVLQVAQATTLDLNGDGNIDQYGATFEGTDIFFPTHSYGQFFVANGGKLFEPNDQGGYDAAINSAAALDFLEFSAELVNYVPSDWISYDQDMMRNHFADGRSAMYFNFGTWEWQNGIIDDAGINYGLSVFPEGMEGSGATIGGFNVGIGAGSEHKEEAWAVLEFLNREDILPFVTRGDNLPPTNTGFGHEPFNQEHYRVFAEQFESAAFVGETIPEMNEIADIWNEYFQRVALGNMEPQDALNQAEQEIQSVLDQMQ